MLRLGDCGLAKNMHDDGNNKSAGYREELGAVGTPGGHMCSVTWVAWLGSNGAGHATCSTHAM